MADTIKNPDEIIVQWVNVGTDSNPIYAVNRLYIANFIIEGETDPMMVVFDMNKFGWTGVTAYSPDDFERILKNRARGTTLYRRGE